MAKALGTVATGKTGEVEAEVPNDEKDIDTLYEDAIHVLNTRPPKAERRVRSRRIIIGLSGQSECSFSGFTEFVDVDQFFMLTSVSNFGRGCELY